jgi:predicted O-methyltransferase YrrM
VKFALARQFLAGIPYTRPHAAFVLYRFVLDAGVSDILELGFAHGTSTCYMAAALEERGSGSIVSIDRPAAQELDPNLETLLDRMVLSRYVQPIHTPMSYTWELMKLIERCTVDGVCQPRFDFCFVDGAHTWEVDGFAFFLVDKLLKPGGWILFDDLGWRMSDDPKLRANRSVQVLPKEVRDTPQVARIFELLVCQHPSYTRIKIDEGWGRAWGWARKSVPNGAEAAPADVTNRLVAMLRRRSALLAGWRAARSILRRR